MGIFIMYGFEIRLILAEVTPLVERKLIIPSNISFKKLHEIISIVFNLNKNGKYKFVFDKINLEISDTGSLNRDIVDSRYEKIDKYFQAFSEVTYINDFWEITLDIRQKDYDERYPQIISFKGLYNPVPEISSTNEFSEFIEMKKNKDVSFKFKFKRVNQLKIQEDLMVLFQVTYEIVDNNVIEVKTQKTLDNLLD